jgi:hypothetical protein
VFVIFTTGQDSVSDLRYTKQMLLEKIQHQQNIYNWQFQYPIAEVSYFHSTVVRISEPIKKTTFQFAADIVVPENRTPESVYESVIDCVYEWVNLKLGTSTPERRMFNEGIEFDKFILPSLHVAIIPKENQWCCRLVHADETSERRKAIPGMTWTSDIALHLDGNKIHFAMQVFVIATNNVDQIAYNRPRLIMDIAKQFELVTELPLQSKEAMYVSTDDELLRIHDAIMSPVRNIPIVLITKEQNEELLSIIFKTQIENERQSILAFAHIIALPDELWKSWNQYIGEDLSIPQNGISIYYPPDSEVKHKNFSLEEINAWQWDNSYGMFAFAIFLKDCLSKYAAEKTMDLRSCLFYPMMRSRLRELRLEQVKESQSDSDYIVELEEDNVAQKKTIEEQKFEIKQLQKERFNLTQQVQDQYRPKLQEQIDEKPKVRIRLNTKKELDKIDGKSSINLHNIIEKCKDKQWRNRHIDGAWNKNGKTDLTVIKPGATAERVVGFEKDEIFYITHVFDSHDEYEQSLPYCWIKEFCNDEYVEID